MEEDPIELSPGKLGCPSCKIPLVDGLTPYYHEGDKIGSFDGIICEMCGYGLLTEKGCEDSINAVKSLGYITTNYSIENKYIEIIYQIFNANITENDLDNHTPKMKVEMSSENFYRKILSSFTRKEMIPAMASMKIAQSV